MKNTNYDLTGWQEKLAIDQRAYDGELLKMDDRELLYKGDKKIVPLSNRSKTVLYTPHVRNVVAEMIESQIDTTIPQPVVTSPYSHNEELATLIENKLKCEVNRLPSELINDMLCRTVPIQGCGFCLVEWDNTQRTHSTVGEITIRLLHPKQVIPQNGVYGSIEEMDHIFVKLPQTREYISRKYGVTLEDTGEAEPEIRSISTASDPADGLVTQYIAYYRNKDGGIGKFSWVNETILEDMVDYQKR